MTIDPEKKALVLRRLRSIAAAANDAQERLDDLEAFGALIEDMGESLADIVAQFGGPT